jgi:hypothetical protein
MAGASAPLVLLELNKDQLLTELLGKAKLSGFRRGKRFLSILKSPAG